MKRLFLLFLLAPVAFFSCKEEKKDPSASAEDQEKMALINDLKLKVQQNPDSASVRMLLVNTLDSIGAYAEAITQVDSLILKDSANNGLWYAKAQLQESKGDTLGAIYSYERALQIYPSIEAQLSLANLMAEHKDKRALSILQNISQMRMGREVDANCDFIAGVYFARTGNNDKALQTFDNCINNSYTYMEAYMEKGFIYFEKKQYPQALEIFDRAITVNNTYADAYYWKAKTNEAMGNKEDAILNYERSLGLDKNLKEARAALERLKG